MLVPFLDENPPRRRKARRRKGGKRRPPRGFRSWKAYMASIRPGGKKRRRRRKKETTVARRKHRRRHRNPVGRRSHRRRSRGRARSHRRRSHRSHRNPPRLLGRGRGIIGRVISTGVDAFEVLLGKAATNKIASFVPVAQTGPVGVLTKIAAAVAASWAIGKVNRNAGNMALLGGILAVIEPPVKELNIPLLSEGLADYPSDFYRPGPLAVGSYPQPRLGSYPTFSGTDDFAGDDDMASMGQA